MQPITDHDTHEVCRRVRDVLDAALHRAQQRAADERSISEEHARNVPRSEGVKVPRFKPGTWRAVIARLFMGRRLRSA